MRFTYAEALTDPSFYLPLAQAAERAGYSSITIADSLAYPRDSDSKYPYTDTGDREFLEDKAFIETFTLAAAMSSVTSTIRFLPFVLKLAVRQPALVAKQAMSVAFLSNNRLGLGIGLSPWPEDFALMGVPWERRGKRMDEQIDILRGLMSGEFFEYHGEFHDIAATKMTPAPSAPVPLLVGGHSDAALRRAVLKGDGWMHAGGDGEELNLLLDKIDKIRDAEGVADKPFELHVISYDAFTVDGATRMEDRGVPDGIVGFRVPYIKGPDTEPQSKKIEHLERFAESVVAKVNR
jgi:probable F420-dependent oxidoreductase